MPFDPDQPRDEFGRWTDGGVQTEIITTHKDAGAALKAAASDFGEAIKSLNEQAERLIEKAKEALPEIQQMSKEIAAKYGAVVTENANNIKTKESIIRKANSKYNGNVDRLTDAARTTIVAFNSNDIDAIVNDIKKSPGVTEVDFKTPDNDPLGYKGAAIKYRAKNGLIAEIQVNTAKMIYAKEDEVVAKGLIGERLYNDIQVKTGLTGGKGHKYYEEYRSTDIFNPSNSGRIIELTNESRNYYKNFY